MTDDYVADIDMIKKLYLLTYVWVLDIFGNHENNYVIRLWSKF
jgi:hypothetical protein